MVVFVLLFCLGCIAFHSPAGKGLGPWLSCLWCVHTTFPFGVLGSTWNLIVRVGSGSLPPFLITVIRKKMYNHVNTTFLYIKYSFQEYSVNGLVNVMMGESWELGLMHYLSLLSPQTEDTEILKIEGK